MALSGGVLLLVSWISRLLGGGRIQVDPRHADGLTTLRQTFQLELDLPPQIRHEYLGARVYVRFDHGWEPVGFQAWRALRQLLLRRLDV